MKKLILLLITLIIFANVSFSQEEGLSIEGGLGTVHSTNFLSFNYDYKLKDNLYLNGSLGFLTVAGVGIKYANPWKDRHHSLSLGAVFPQESEIESLLLRYAWAKEIELGSSDKWSFSYGFQIVLVEFYKGGKDGVDNSKYEDPNSPYYDRDFEPEKIWKIETYASTKGDFYSLLFLPMPLVNFKYHF